jgi:hypothetical protein
MELNFGDIKDTQGRDCRLLKIIDKRIGIKSNQCGVEILGTNNRVRIDRNDDV